VFATDKKGKSIKAKDLGGILNSGVWKSLLKQQNMGDLRVALYDVVKHEGAAMEDAPYKDKWGVITEVQKQMPDFDLPGIAKDTTSKKKMFSDILSGKNPRTSEGVVLWKWEDPSPPIKSKIKQDYDVYVSGIFPSVHPGWAGGFEYSHTPDGPIVGKVGTGFTVEERESMWRNPEDYIGRTAVVFSTDKYESGALRAPSFSHWHLTKSVEKK
jgi:hypothetical protein